MSGGELIILDRAGRAGKRYPLLEGLATIGSGTICDIRVLQTAVDSHHATVVVRNNQTVIRNVSDGVTLVNECPVSVAALRHGDIITIGSRSLRWEYSNPDLVLQSSSPLGAVFVRRRAAGWGGGARAAGSGGPGGLGGLGGSGGPERDRELQLALEMSRRASMPAGVTGGGKQVAIVQPQRRAIDTPNESNPRLVVKSHRPFIQTYKRQRITNQSVHSLNESDNTRRKSNARKNSNSAQKDIQNTTKATMWIESRKSSPRRSLKTNSPVQSGTPTRMSVKRNTSLRMAVLRKTMTPGPNRTPAAARVTKIQAPLKIDHTKQAALLLMAGAARRSAGPGSPTSPASPASPTSPVSPASPASPARPARLVRPPIPALPAQPGLELDALNTSRKNNRSLRSGTDSPQVTPSLPKPKKSALKQPDAKNVTRKTESITFDLSNLEDNTLNDSVEQLLLSKTTLGQSLRSGRGNSETTSTFHHSNTSNNKSPSPTKAAQSRSNKILEKSLGTPVNLTQSLSQRSLTHSPSSRKSSRGSVIVQKALEVSKTRSSRSRFTNSVSDHSEEIASADRTRNSSAQKKKMETYSIVNLVSGDSNDSKTYTNCRKSYSVYNSADSSVTSFDTPRDSVTRKSSTSAIDLNVVASSTPYVRHVRQSQRSRSSTTVSDNKIVNNEHSKTSSRKVSKRSKSLTTPENSHELIPVISARASRASKSRSRINDSELLFISSQLDDENEDTSPVTSRRGKSSLSQTDRTETINSSIGSDPTTPESTPMKTGEITPNNTCSPQNIGTPKLSIQHLLDSSVNLTINDKKNMSSQRRSTRGRNTLGESKQTFTGKSKSSKSLSVRRTLLRVSGESERSDRTAEVVQSVTPTSSVLPLHEPVKNKHSTAKKTQSKRSLIDNLDHSDIVKQLFNSPVKRKLSQSMTEFSKRQFEDVPKKRTRNTLAVVRRTPNQSLQNVSEAITPDMFVSSISTPNNSPNLEGIKRLFDKNSPDNDLRNVRGVRNLLRTPGKRKSAKNDLTNISGVKRVFRNSPRNRLSNIEGVKNLYKRSPTNDLRKVSGVKALFQSEKRRRSPRNDLTDVSGVKRLFREQKSPINDLTNVSGVKKTLQVNSPQNDLRDVRGVKQIFRRERRDDLNDVSGVEQLFDESTNSHRDMDELFDQLVGKPKIKAVYSKSLTKSSQKPRSLTTNSLHVPLDTQPDQIEQWLQDELQKRIDSKITKSQLNNNSKLSRELKKLNMNAVASATTPVSESRTRNSTIKRANTSVRSKMPSEVYSARRLPIKKRSLVEVSLERSDDDKTLPIKKRIIHSTPLKAQFSVTANASELGRVSPITSIDYTNVINNTTARAEHQDETKSKPKKTGKAKIVNMEATIVSPVKVSPRKTRGKNAQEKEVNALPTRATRRRKLTEVESDAKNMKKLKKSPVKKSPAPSPKIILSKNMRNRKQTQAINVPIEPANSPKKRVTRAKKSQVNTPQEIKTPKNTRARVVRKSIVVVGKPSPQLKPQTRRRDLHNKDSANDVGTNKLVKETEPVKRKRTDVASVEVTQARPRRGGTLPTDAKPKTRTQKTEVTLPPPRTVKRKEETEETTREVRNRRNVKEKNKLEVVESKTVRKARSAVDVPVVIEETNRGRKRRNDKQETTDLKNVESRPKRGTKKPVEQESKVPKATGTTRTQMNKESVGVSAAAGGRKRRLDPVLPQLEEAAQAEQVSVKRTRRAQPAARAGAAGRGRS